MSGSVGQVNMSVFVGQFVAPRWLFPLTVGRGLVPIKYGPAFGANQADVALAVFANPIAHATLVTADFAAKPFG